MINTDYFLNFLLNPARPTNPEAKKIMVVRVWGFLVLVEQVKTAVFLWIESSPEYSFDVTFIHSFIQFLTT